MDYTYVKNKITVKNVLHFHPKHTFDCGQCFRWYEENDGSFTGVVMGRVLNVSFLENTLVIDNITEDDFNNIFVNYFDLNRNYASVKKLYEKDGFLKDAMDFGWGIHILNQDIFECLISFIISTQNQIPRIKKIVNGLSEMFGDKIEYKDNIYYSFPTAEQLKCAKAEDFNNLKAGYRGAYIVDAVEKVLSGEVNLIEVLKMSYKEAKAELMKIKGVGPKVADCVLLFSAGKSEAFPVDVWVKRTMNKLYMEKESNEKQILAFAEKYFGEYAGFAQQYMFYYSRENNLS